MQQYVNETLIKDVIQYMNNYHTAEKYVKQGWSQVKIEVIQMKRIDQMKHCCNENCSCRVFQEQERFLFESKNDASWFTLRWL